MVRRYAVHEPGHSEAAMTQAAAADDSRMRRARIRWLSPGWEISETVRGPRDRPRIVDSDEGVK
jgi:hypothetical protein